MFVTLAVQNDGQIDQVFDQCLPTSDAGAVLTCICAFGWCVGAAPVAYGDCEIVPEKAHGDAGSGAAGVEPGHAGENRKSNSLASEHLKTENQPDESQLSLDACLCEPVLPRAVYSPLLCS